MTRVGSRLLVLGVLIGAGVLPVLLLTVTATQMVMFIPAVHIIVVGTAGLAAAVAATALSIIGARRNDGRAVWTGMAFSVIATMLLIHALATPDALLGSKGVVQIAERWNLPISGTILAASALPVLDAQQDLDIERPAPHEREILTLVAGGRSNQEIATELVISERTARTHVSNILRKLDLRSRTQAALWAREHGLAVIITTESPI